MRAKQIRVNEGVSTYNYQSTYEANSDKIVYTMLTD